MDNLITSDVNKRDWILFGYRKYYKKSAKQKGMLG